MLKVSFIGASNIAYRYTLAMLEKGIAVSRIYNRSAQHRDSLVKALRDNGSDAKAAENLEDLMDSDIVFIAVNDDAIKTVVGNIEETLKRFADSPANSESTSGNQPDANGHYIPGGQLNKLPVFIHTSGATDINVFAPLEALGCKYGVL